MTLQVEKNLLSCFNEGFLRPAASNPLVHVPFFFPPLSPKLLKDTCSGPLRGKPEVPEPPRTRLLVFGQDQRLAMEEFSHVPGSLAVSANYPLCRPVWRCHALTGDSIFS